MTTTWPLQREKKKFDKDGVSSYEKHKIFLYKEDFEKFAEGLEDAVAVVKSALEGNYLKLIKEVKVKGKKCSSHFLPFIITFCFVIWLRKK